TPGPIDAVFRLLPARAPAPSLRRLTGVELTAAVVHDAAAHNGIAPAVVVRECARVANQAIGFDVVPGPVEATADLLVGACSGY
ncbi:MAG: hypothetical protein JO291_08680, partial [Acidimicrobiia bacterium]|nr:hypothetical protein [Acidimicrobiia bacterium]